MDKLITELKEQIALQLKIKNITPENIGDDEPLFGPNLDLDSLDVLELIAFMRQKYKVRVATAEEGKKVFQTVNTMAQYIVAHQTIKA